MNERMLYFQKSKKEYTISTLNLSKFYVKLIVIKSNIMQIMYNTCMVKGNMVIREKILLGLPCVGLNCSTSAEKKHVVTTTTKMCTG